MKTATRRTLAELCAKLGDDGTAWRQTLYSLAVRSDPRAAEAIEFAAGNVYPHVDGEPDDAEEFVRAWLDVYEIETLADVDRLLGRQRHEEDNYRGRVAMGVDR